MSFKTEAFVLRYRNWNNADRLYSLFTPHEGIIDVISKSAAKSSSKLAGHLLPFSKIKVMIGRGKFDHLAGVETLEHYSNINKDIKNMSLASLIAELFLKSDSGTNKYDEFILLEDILQIIDNENISKEKKLILVRIFLWKYLSISGWRPELNNCLLCNKKINNNFKYLSGRGIVCREHTDEALNVSDELIHFLRYILESNWILFKDLKINNSLNKEWLKVSQLFYQAVYNQPYQSLKLFTYG